MCSICERSIIEHKVKKLSREIFIILLVSYLIEGNFSAGFSNFYCRRDIDANLMGRIPLIGQLNALFQSDSGFPSQLMNP